MKVTGKPTIPRLERVLRALEPVKGKDLRSVHIALDRLNVVEDEDTGTLRLSCWLETDTAGTSHRVTRDVLNLSSLQDEAYDALFAELFTKVFDELCDRNADLSAAVAFAMR